MLRNTKLSAKLSSNQLNSEYLIKNEKEAKFNVNNMWAVCDPCVMLNLYHRARIISWRFCGNIFWNVTHLAQKRNHKFWIQEVQHLPLEPKICNTIAIFGGEIETPSGKKFWHKNHQLIKRALYSTNSSTRPAVPTSLYLDQRLNCPSVPVLLVFYSATSIQYNSTN